MTHAPLRPTCPQPPKARKSARRPRPASLLGVAAVLVAGGTLSCDWNVDYLRAGGTVLEGGDERGSTEDASALDANEDALGDAADGGEDATVDAEVEAAAEGASDAPTCDPGAPEGGINTIVNPGFEDPADAGGGWFAVYGGTFLVSSTNAHCGKHSGEVTARTAFYDGIGTSLPSIGTYNVSLWVMQDGTTAYQIAPAAIANCGADAGMSYFHLGYPSLQPNVWTQVVGTITIPNGCSGIQLAVGGNTSTTGVYPNLFVDDVYAVQ